MMRNKGRVVSKEKIEEHVWDFDYEGGSNIVEVYIKFLRKTTIWEKKVNG